MATSRWCTIKEVPIPSGVPQGSHLGPLIFILFVNDICQRLQSQKLLYADDLKIFRTVTSVLNCVALQQDIDMIQEWCSLNGMKVNPSKCKSISFTRSTAPIRHEYTFDHHELDRVSSIRDLGLLIDCKLNFSEHVSATTAKAFAMLGFLRRNTAEFENINALKTLYITMVRSILEYAVQVWANQRQSTPINVTAWRKFSADSHCMPFAVYLGEMVFGGQATATGVHFFICNRSNNVASTFNGCSSSMSSRIASTARKFVMKSTCTGQRDG